MKYYAAFSLYQRNVSYHAQKYCLLKAAKVAYFFFQVLLVFQLCEIFKIRNAVWLSVILYEVKWEGTVAIKYCFGLSIVGEIIFLPRPVETGKGAMFFN